MVSSTTCSPTTTLLRRARNPIEALYIWRAGSGSGAPSPWARSGSSSPPVAGACGCCRSSTAIAPTVLVAQAIGRWGNWFNQELFAKPTDLPWALEIDAEHRPPGYFLDDTFHPTFLYEFLWNLGAFGFVVWADRRFGRARPVARST